MAPAFLTLIAQLKVARKRQGNEENVESSGSENDILTTLRTIESGLCVVQGETSVHAQRLLMLINALSQVGRLNKCILRKTNLSPQCTSASVQVTKVVESCLTKARALAASEHLSQPLQRELVEKQLEKSAVRTSVEPGELADDVEMVEEEKVRYIFEENLRKDPNNPASARGEC